jgi:hypothetical protein
MSDVQEYAKTIEDLSGSRYRTVVEGERVLVVAENRLLANFNAIEAGAVAVLMQNAVNEDRKEFI